MHNSFYSMLFYFIVAAITLVYFIMFVYMVRFRKQQKNNFHRSFTVELIWFLLPILILAVLLIPVYKFISA